MPGREAGPAEPPWERQPVEDAEPDPHQQDASRRQRGEVSVERARDVHGQLARAGVAGGGGKRPDAGRLRLGEGAKDAELGGAEPRRAPSAGRGGRADASREGPEHERGDDEESVDQEIEEVREDVVVEEVRAEGHQR